MRRAGCSPESPESGSVLVEFAIAVPFLLALVFSLYAVAKLMSQVSWFATTSYESVMAGGSIAEVVATNEIYRIKDMFAAEQNRDAATLSLTPSFYDVNDASGETVSLVSVDLSGTLGFSSGAMKTAGVSVGFVGPHIGNQSGIIDEVAFVTIKGPYDCSGANCGQSGQPACPTSPCS